MSDKMSDSDDDVIFIREEHHVKVVISKVNLTQLQDENEEDNVTHISETEMSPDSDTSSNYFPLYNYNKKALVFKDIWYIAFNIYMYILVSF